MSEGIDINDRIEEVFEELENFVYYLAGGAQNPNVPLMDFDEITGELFLEIVKGVQYYPDLPNEQLLAVVRKMLDNRISELLYRYCITHRKALIDTEDINILDRYVDGSNGSDDAFMFNVDIKVIADVSMQLNPEVLAESNIRMEELRSRLSSNALRVLDAMLYGNELLHTQIVLSEIRAKHVHGYADVTPKMRPWQVGDSIGFDEQEVRNCIQEIKTTYRQVLNEY